MMTKNKLRSIVARLLFRTRITQPDRCSREFLSIATFHRVLPEPLRKTYPFPGLAVTPEELDLYLTYFKKNFDCGTLAEQYKRYRSKERSERPLLAITFDDGQHDNFLYALPILAKHGIKASFFVPVLAMEEHQLLWHDRLGFAALALLNNGDTGRQQLLQTLALVEISLNDMSNPIQNIAQQSKNISLEARLNLVKNLTEASGTDQTPSFARLMTFDELRNLAAAGHEIGSHSMTHCLMPECNDQDLQYEVIESRKRLQAYLHLPIESFCYPNGNADERTARVVESAGYLQAITTEWGHVDHDADRFLLRRYDMVTKHVVDSYGHFLPELLAFRMSGLYPGLPA
jgi:peptidoglycan/xylan/chitin deacetylase (PgdA/CDA1 family)